MSIGDNQDSLVGVASALRNRKIRQIDLYAIASLNSGGDVAGLFYGNRSILTRLYFTAIVLAAGRGIDRLS